MGLKIYFDLANSLWSHGINHYSYHVVVSKIKDQDKKIALKEAMTMASWTHNMSVNIHGYTQLQLVTGKWVLFPRITTGSTLTHFFP